MPTQRILSALACVSERSLGITDDALTDEVITEAKALTEPLGTLALGSTVHAAMIADGVPASVIDRAAFYAMHYWDRGRAFADSLANALWTPEDTAPASVSAGGSPAIACTTCDADITAAWSGHGRKPARCDAHKRAGTTKANAATKSTTTEGEAA